MQSFENETLKESLSQSIFISRAAFERQIKKRRTRKSAYISEAVLIEGWWF
jgi:hypothetical protein